MLLLEVAAAAARVLHAGPCVHGGAPKRGRSSASPLACPLHCPLPLLRLQTVRSKDGATAYTVFDKCAVRIAVEEGAAGRRSLVLRLVPRSELPESELAH